MSRLIALVLLSTCWSAQAATLVTVGTFSSGSDSNSYSYSDGDPDYIEGSVNIGDIPVYGLSQFNPTLGTVTGITVSASYTMDVTANIEVYEALEFDQPHSAGFIMTEGYNTGVASLVRYDSTVDAPGHVRTLLFEVLDISVACDAAAFEDPCMNSVMDTLTVSSVRPMYSTIPMHSPTCLLLTMRAPAPLMARSLLPACCTTVTSGIPVSIPSTSRVQMGGSMPC